MSIAPQRAGGCSADDVRAAIERFLKASIKPALIEPGEEVLPLSAENFVLDIRNTRLTLQAWDRERNLVRRVTGVREESRGRLELIVERFARKEGRLFLIDQACPAGREMQRRGTRFVFREQFRHFLRRQFPAWDLAELSVEADLAHSLSAVYPRALLKKGQSAWAAIAAPRSHNANGVLSFGLIWMDYLRHRERRLTVEGLALFLPSGHERITCLRLPFLDAGAAQFQIFSYSEEGNCAPLDPCDAGNLDTHLETCRTPVGPEASIERLAALPGVQQVLKNDGSCSLRINGLEFARANAEGALFGLSDRIPLRDHNMAEAERLAVELARWRSVTTDDREHPLYRRNPEAWLESQVRAQIERIDPTILPEPLYGQVPAFAGGDRDLLDMLAVDRSGRLVVLELKASEDLHLPLQALDYWMRVKWHLDRDEFSSRGYFPGATLRRKSPRLLLLSPALEFHPTSETILRFFSPEVDVERIGVGLEWRKELQIAFRVRGAQQP